MCRCLLVVVDSQDFPCFLLFFPFVVSLLHIIIDIIWIRSLFSLRFFLFASTLGVKFLVLGVFVAKNSLAVLSQIETYFS